MAPAAPSRPRARRRPLAAGAGAFAAAPALATALALAASLAAVLVLSACGGPAPTPPPPPPPPERPSATPSVVIVALTGLRYDAVWPTEGAPLYPSFAAFAAKATAFLEAATCATWEVPAVAGLLTGMAPGRSGVRGVPGASAPRLIPVVKTVASRLRPHGYASAGFVAGAALPRPADLQQGFDAWDAQWRMEAPEAAHAVAAWLAARPKDRPFVLFLHGNARATVPGPETPAPEAAVRAREAYAARAGAVDAGLARVLAALDAASLPADTVVVLASAHGQGLRERPDAQDDGVGTTVHDEVARVPLAIRAPGMPAGVVQGSCGLVDVVPTLRDLMGLPPAEGLSGRSLVVLAKSPTASGAPISIQAWRYATGPAGPTDETLYALRTASTKFVAVLTTRPAGWAEQVFDLRADPVERSPQPATGLERHGPEFVRVVAALREVLEGRRSLIEDEIAGPYIAAGAGPK